MYLNSPTQEFCWHLAKCWQCRKDCQTSLLAVFTGVKNQQEFWIYEKRQDVTQSRSKKSNRPSWNLTTSSSDEILLLILSVKGKTSCHHDLYHAGLKARNSQRPHTTQRNGWRIQPLIHSGRRKIVCGSATGPTGNQRAGEQLWNKCLFCF